MKRLIILILILFMFSCKESDNNKTSILFQHYFTGNLSSGIDDLTKIINSNQNDFILISTPLEHEEFKVSIRVQLESPNPPDIFSYWAGAKTKYLVDNNKIQPITNFYNSIKGKNIFDPSTIEACSYNGEMYMLPLTRHFVGFFYNKQIFDKFNLSAPTTWDELLEISEILKQNNITPFSLGAKTRWPAQFWFDYLLLRTAGYNYRQELMNNLKSYTNQEVIDAVNLWKTLIDKEYFNPDMALIDWDEALLKLTTQEAAMTLMGTWAIPTLDSALFEADKDYSFFPFPTINPNIDAVSLGPIDGIIISKESRNSEKLDEILNQFASLKAQEGFNHDSGAIAPHTNVSDSIYSPVQLQIKEIIKNSKYWAFNYDLATSPSISESGLNFFYEFIQNTNNYEEKLLDLEKKANP
ncbi:MAG: extracellular solute-binding protein [Spirochaetales bacterium]|nr:extracellular solute-binding protein [Spirochaetales bacterium]